MSKITSPLIKGNDPFAIIEGHVFIQFSHNKQKQKERNKNVIFTSPLIKGDDPFAIIEGHVFMTIYKKKKEEPMFLSRALLKISRSTYILFKVIPHKSLSWVM